MCGTDCGEGVKMNITYYKQAVKALERIDTATKQRIKQGIENIPKGDIKPLKGSDGDYRLRIGNWRVLFSYADDDTLQIKRIAPRGEVYKGV